MSIPRTSKVVIVEGTDKIAGVSAEEDEEEEKEEEEEEEEDEEEDEHNPETIQKLAEIRAEIRSLYLSGAPLFTREALQDVARQLRAVQGRDKGGKHYVNIIGINGIMVKSKMWAGCIIPYPHEHKETIIGDPLIYYCSIQYLTSTEHRPLLRLAYCSLQIHYHSILRHSTTKQILDADSDLTKCGKEDTLQIFKPNQSQWDESEECRLLKSVLQSINALSHVKQIVAFACGPIMRDLKLASPRSSYQHALILTLRDILLPNASKTKEESSGRAISCYAQEPAYTEAEKSILEEHGIAVLDDPDGFLKVDESTLVVSFAPNVPVKQITMDLARPAAMIWNRIVEERDDGILWTDPDSCRIRKIVSDFYDVFEFPGSADNFGNVALYVRRTTEAILTQSAVPASSLDEIHQNSIS